MYVQFEEDWLSSFLAILYANFENDVLRKMRSKFWKIKIYDFIDLLISLRSQNHTIVLQLSRKARFSLKVALNELYELLLSPASYDASVELLAGYRQRTIYFACLLWYPVYTWCENERMTFVEHSSSQVRCNLNNF